MAFPELCSSEAVQLRGLHLFFPPCPAHLSQVSFFACPAAPCTTSAPRFRPGSPSASPLSPQRSSEAGGGAVPVRDLQFCAAGQRTSALQLTRRAPLPPPTAMCELCGLRRRSPTRRRPRDPRPLCWPRAGGVHENPLAVGAPGRGGGVGG